MYKASEKRYDKMKYNRCGNSGLKLPAVSLGLWHNFGTNDSYKNMVNLCCTAFDEGITHFDLANNYGPEPGSAEENFGKILHNELKGYRDELIVSTKAGYGMWDGPYGDWGSKKYLTASLDQSLKRLNLPYVDIFYHHRMDPHTPLEETMYTLSLMVKQGKALYVGISNYDKKTTKKAAKILKELKCPFIINQIRYSMLDRWIEEDGLKAWAGENGCGLIAFSPLAQGLLTDKYLNGVPDDSRAKKEGQFLNESDITEERVKLARSLNEIAKQRGQSLAQMALSWVLKDKELTSVLIGASRPEQIIDNVAALDKLAFSEEEIQKIEQLIG